MKNLIFLVLIAVTVSFSQVTSNNSMGLSRWGAWNKLNSGTIGDTASSNNSLNRNFDLISALWMRQHNKKGWFTSLYGDSTANLIIGLAGSQHNKRVVFNDSVYMYYNLFSEGNAVFGGNVTIGGYLTVDSIQTSGDIWIPNDLTVGGNVRGNGYGSFSYVSGDSMLVAGTPSIYDGKINMYSGLSNRYIQLKSPPTITAPTEKILYIPNATTGSYLATRTENDSLQAPTVHAVLFNSEKVATATLNDTSALFTDWQANTTTEYPIVRLKYLHKAGITSIKARYYAYIAGGGDNWEANIKAGSLTSATSSGSNSSYGSMTTTSLTVSGLTANTLYDLTFNIGINTLGTSHFKELVITAESN